MHHTQHLKKTRIHEHTHLLKDRGECGFNGRMAARGRDSGPGMLLVWLKNYSYKLCKSVTAEVRQDSMNLICQTPQKESRHSYPLPLGFHCICPVQGFLFSCYFPSASSAHVVGLGAVLTVLTTVAIKHCCTVGGVSSEVDEAKGLAWCICYIISLSSVVVCVLVLDVWHCRFAAR